MLTVSFGTLRYLADGSIDLFLLLLEVIVDRRVVKLLLALKNVCYFL